MRNIILIVGLAACGLAGCDELGRGRPAPKAAQEAGGIVAPGGVAPTSFAKVVRSVAPAVVSIDTLSQAEAQSPWADLVPREGAATPVRRGAGSGFIISADGAIVTNNHVVEGAQEIVVGLADGRQFPARLVGRDPLTDLAVLRVQAKGLPHVSFARTDPPQVGDWVLAVGNPFGLGGTATAGIVSALARDIGQPYVSYMQIDAPINSGNSGGPTFDLSGRVVGVNTANISPSGGSVGIGFAIPADVASSVVAQLISSGRVTRGYLGVGVQDLTPAIAARLGARGHQGALIVDVQPNGPAAGQLRPGDIVTAVNGEAIIAPSGLMRALAKAQPGAKLALTVLRDGQNKSVTVTVAQHPGEA